LITKPEASPRFVIIEVQTDDTLIVALDNFYKLEESELQKAKL
jgi:hypothetical protein